MSERGTVAEDSGLRGRVALITGAAAGMGRAHALALAERGALVSVLDIDGPGAERTAAEIEQAGGSAMAWRCDVADADAAAARRCVEAILEQHGRLDILVNNAGIGGENARIEEVDERRFERMFSVHARASFFFGKHAMEPMKRQRRGRIINTASRWFMTGHETSSHYIGAKSAIVGMTKAWAKELAPYGITANAVAPGGVWTDMVLKARGAEFIRAEERKVPLGRWAQPDEYARLVVYLASDEAAFVTGQVISPNGGASIVGM
ncbi:MAG TPA: SDR family NAD(P)-dependent oxidoreductase [Stellaceae bacterium]|nr:SDR family NAD(P)-dependent oxidoreductase [Stellaceae bacterium]